MNTESIQLTAVVIIVPTECVLDFYVLFCWGFLIFFSTHAQTIHLLWIVFQEAEGKENFAQHLVLMCSSLAFWLPPDPNQTSSLYEQSEDAGVQDPFVDHTCMQHSLVPKQDSGRRMICVTLPATKRVFYFFQTSRNRKATQTRVCWLIEHYSLCINLYSRYLPQNVIHLKHSLAFF